jgi:hypothetical protein
MRVVEVGLVLGSVITLWIVVGGGGAIELGGRTISIHGLRNPLRITLLCAVLRLLLSDAAGTRWRLPRLSLRLAHAPPRLRLQVLGLVVALGCAWGSLLRLGELVPKVRLSLQGAQSSVREDGWNMHLGPLVRWVTEENEHPEVALYVEDVNSRGHLAAFYCYPRLLRMHPAQQEWSLFERIANGGKRDPGFQTEVRKPDASACVAWAHARALPLVIARPAGVEIFPPLR